jgi:hypothetical protein
MRLFFFLLCTCALFSESAMAANNEKIVYGFIEKATLLDKDLVLSAKLDTGAKSASLNATHISPIKIGDKPYLRFIVPTKEGDVTFECEYVGEVNIKVRAGERQASQLLNKFIQRPVVLMKIRLANNIQEIRVNLTNRKRFIYPLLLGRQAIKAFNGLVDPSRKYVINTETDNAKK